MTPTIILLFDPFHSMIPSLLILLFCTLHTTTAVAALDHTKTASSSSRRIQWIVRPATPNDATAATHLLQTCYSQLLPNDYDDPDLLKIALPRLTGVRPELLTCGTWWYLVEHPDQPDELVGCGGWTPTSPTGEGIPHLRHFATNPKYLRMGIGRAIWEQCQRDMKHYYHHDKKNEEDGREQHHGDEQGQKEGRHQLPSLPTEMQVYSTLTAKAYYESLGFHTREYMTLAITPDCDFPCILMSLPWADAFC
jgi:GNAT superfamily N-acetyltransferase